MLHWTMVPSWLSDQIVTKTPILDIGTERFSNSESPCHYKVSNQVSAQSDLLFGSRCDYRFSRWQPWWPSWISKRNHLAIQYLHAAQMPSIKFPLQPTYGSGAGGRGEGWGWEITTEDFQDGRHDGCLCVEVYGPVNQWGLVECGQFT